MKQKKILHKLWSAGLRVRYSAAKNGKPVKKAIVYTQNEHHINLADVDTEAKFIIDRLKSLGFDTYIVGGAVRDLLLGKKPKDFDIATAASPAAIRRIFRNSRIIGRRFRLVHVFFGSRIFEVSTFRSSDNGKPEPNFGSVEEDAFRRDFSINALLYDTINQVIVDYVGGMKDIERRRIRPIIPISKIFIEDPVRMIRAVKYGATTGFTLPFLLRLKIKTNSSLLKTISHSRLTEELIKIINSPFASKIIAGLNDMELYQYLQPQAASLFKTKKEFKKLYLKSLDNINSKDYKNRPGEALSALVKDYLEFNADWDGSKTADVRPVQERYREAFKLARKFVLPMNPPRIELEYAVRLLFMNHGIAVKRGKFNEKRITQ